MINRKQRQSYFADTKNSPIYGISSSGRVNKDMAEAVVTESTIDQPEEEQQDKDEVKQSDKVLYSLESILNCLPQSVVGK